MTATASKNGHIDKDEVLAQLTPQVVATIYERAVGQNHRAAGEWRKCPSPFYQDSSDNPGFNWHPVTGHYRDHSKDEKGDIFDFVMRSERHSFTEAVAYVAEVEGLTPKPTTTKAGQSQILKAYDYVDENGKLLSQTVRWSDKRFTQRQPRPGGGWINNLQGVRRVPYRLPELIAANPIDDVISPEGEKDVDRAVAEGFVATTNAMGAGNWHNDQNAYFADRHVVLIPDNDAPGRAHVQNVATKLYGIAETIKIVTLPGLPEKGDLSDWFDADGTAQALRHLIMQAPEWRPATTDETFDDYDETPEPTRAPRFTLVTPSQLKQRPAPEWMIEGILLEDSLSAIVGAPGSFKSFVALDMALSIAGGHPWNGHAVRRGPVVYISAEGSKGVPKRITAWENHHGRTASEDCYFLTDAVQFMESGDVGELLYAIGLLPVRPVYVVVDTLARTMLGYEENSSKDMGVYIAGTDRIRIETGGHVSLLHHVNKAGDTRGSTALPGALDTIIEVKRDDDILTVSCGKQKDAEEFTSFHLLRRIIEVDNDDTSLVLIPSDQTGGATSVNDRKVKAILVDVFGDAGATASQWEATCLEAGVSRATFFRSRKNLLHAGEITADKEGRGARYQPTQFGMEDDGDVF